ncbi:23853_t:CDS:2 [Cetraspora pellucida]|uniref:23853_t:CDS:1 n=1 Tax=Cetraspora pellucida TaxID=1433469 RepID=A0A9N9DHA1_9GLOM|nr:23853_t:CDS:2 [Cetraspora pellucida]
MEFGHGFAIFVVFLALALVVLSFFRVNFTIPEQVTGQLTGYPTWLPKMKEFDGNKLYAVFLFNQTILLLGSYYTIKWTFNPPTRSRLITHFILKDSNSVQIPTIWFDRALAIYIVVTFFSGFTIWFVGIGKIWASIGVFHNAAEFLILFTIGSGGRIKSLLFWLILVFYMSIIITGTTLLEYPYDALLFKVQGLCFDWALVIEFILIYMTTYYEYRHRETDNLNLNLDEPDDNIPAAYSVDHTQLLWLLIIASLSHVLDLHATSIYPQKRIFLPKTSCWKIVVIAVSSIVLSLLTIRLAG